MSIKRKNKGKEAMDFKVRENRLRRALNRQGYVLIKSRRRDPQAIDFGGYMITDSKNCLVAGGDPVAFSLNLDDVEEFVKAPKG